MTSPVGVALLGVTETHAAANSLVLAGESSLPGGGETASDLRRVGEASSDTPLPSFSDLLQDLTAQAENHVLLASQFWAAAEVRLSANHILAPGWMWTSSWG